ncbi:MAG: hypothetical protein ABL907_18130 [Hyphomicrobium sp.]
MPHIGHRGAASGIRTGAVGPVAPPKAVAAVTSQVRLQAKPAPRRERKKARNLRRGPPNLVKVRIQALPPVAEKPKANTLLLFKPAGAPSGKPVVASPVLAGQPPAKPLLSNPGVFPRSPMEDEAARR